MIIKISLSPAFSTNRFNRPYWLECYWPISRVAKRKIDMIVTSLKCTAHCYDEFGCLTLSSDALSSEVAIFGIK
jgi:hypothetical protein